MRPARTGESSVLQRFYRTALNPVKLKNEMKHLISKKKKRK